ncbi:sodium/potassium-transporting ATPase subunit beta-1 [Drosophila virilis]|uniref:sodium/potassium-transporting ATPase subunit beta-1 n=1 Tax=Drosophila virilis TaxID=7244 RepID=UPI001396648C|nr:sodium/potassium-transporting ATPase subunit beta-1 [Drosophila virilis]
MDKKDKDKEDEDEMNKKDKDKEDADEGEIDKKDKDKDKEEDEEKNDAASSKRFNEKSTDNPPATGSTEIEATSSRVFQDARSYATAELNESPNNVDRKNSINNNEPANPMLDVDSKANTKIRYKQSISKTELTSTSRGIGINTHRRENKNQIVHNQTVTNNKRKKLTGQPIRHKGIVKLPNINDEYILDNRPRQNYADCEYHFPRANRWQNIWYDGKQNKYFSRHARNWCYSAIYVAGFLIFVLFFNMAIIRHLTDNLNMTTPVIQMSQPFLIFAPIGSKTEHKLIRYTPRNGTHGGHMRNRLSDFLSHHGRSKGQIKRFGPCQEDNNFGYSTGEPCVFLKINRLIGFKTKSYKYDSEVVRSNFEQVDYTALMHLLLSIPNEEKRKDRIWITCTSPSKNAYVDFYPEAAFKTKFVDAKKFNDIKVHNEKIKFQSKRDMNRLVALKLKNLELNKRNRFTCKIWAYNIKHSKDFGQTEFQMLIEGV